MENEWQNKIQKKSEASVLWQGSIKEGHGEISTNSKVLQSIPYSFGTRFGDNPGTNPEELIAAAHASCFAMATAAGFAKGGIQPESLNVTATVTLTKNQETWTVTASHLDLTGRIPGVSPGQFQEIAEDAKKNCPISRLLKAEITLHAQLDESASRPWAPPPPQ